MRPDIRPAKLSREPGLRRVRTLFGALVATAALVMAVQVVAPVSAMAMIDTSCEDLGDCTGAGGWESGGGGGETGGGWDDDGGGGGSWDGGGGSQGSGGDQGSGGGDQSGGGWIDDGGGQGGGWDEGSGDQGALLGDEVILIEDTKPDGYLIPKQRYCQTLGDYISPLEECPPPLRETPFLIPKSFWKPLRHPDLSLPNHQKDWEKMSEAGVLRAIRECQRVARVLKQLDRYKRFLIKGGWYSREVWQDSGAGSLEEKMEGYGEFNLCTEIINEG